MSERKDQRQENTGTAAEPSAEANAPPLEAGAAAPVTTAAQPTAEAGVVLSAPSEPIAVVPPKADTSFRFALLAACVALAAALGAVTGSLGTMKLASAPAAAEPPIRDTAQQAGVAKMMSELTALKAGVEASNRLAHTQFGKITESVSRLEQRIASATATPAPDITGSVTATNAVAKDASKPVVLEGWVLRDAYRGRALVENRQRVYEVVPGANLPGAGRIETITRQNGRWVVVTSKGLIVSMR
jgi:hypothetical protein